MNLTFRVFNHTDEDYQTCLDIFHAAHPHQPYTLEELKHNDERRNPAFFYERLIVELDGQGVAYGHYNQPSDTFREGKYLINFFVHPAYQRRGIGTAFYEHLLHKIKARNADTINCYTTEDQTATLAFLNKQGFVQTRRSPLSHLDVQAFDPAPFAGLLEKIEQENIKIYSAVEIAKVEPDWIRKWWAIDAQLMGEVPADDPFTPEPVEQFIKWMESPRHLPEGYFIAVNEAGDFIGVSGVNRVPADAERLETSLTGVLKPYRRRGLATVLKVKVIEFAKAYGAQVIRTGNDENNPMYKLNLKLGFQSDPAFLAFRKDL